jgi:hypothetical protein
MHSRCTCPCVCLSVCLCLCLCPTRHAPRNVVHHERSCGAPVVAPRHRPAVPMLIVRPAVGPLRTEALCTHRKRSCPAVSHICSLIFCPATSMMRVPNSTPMVCGLSGKSGRRTRTPHEAKGAGSGIQARRGRTLLVGELVQQTRLAHAHVACHAHAATSRHADAHTDTERECVCACVCVCDEWAVQAEHTRTDDDVLEDVVVVEVGHGSQRPRGQDPTRRSKHTDRGTRHDARPTVGDALTAHAHQKWGSPSHPHLDPCVSVSTT